jgi:hypothetical protein
LFNGKKFDIVWIALHSSTFANLCFPFSVTLFLRGVLLSPKSLSLKRFG